MSPTLDQLNSIIDSEDIRLLPTHLPNAGERKYWWNHVDEIARRATESDMMTVALYARLVFETYPSVETIRPRWSVSGDRGDVYTESSLAINDGYYHPDAQELDEELIEEMENIDDCKALHALHHAVENAMGTRQLEFMRRPEDLFPHSGLSVDEIDPLIAKIDPEIRAFYEQKLLTLKTPSISTPKSPGRF